MVDDVFKDDIWTKSSYQIDRWSVDKTLKSLVKGRDDIYVHLVDTIFDDDRFVITDNYCKKNHLALWPEFYGIYFYQPEYISRLPTKLFSCFMNRPDFVRQSWLYQFVRRGMLDKGAVSYRLHFFVDDMFPHCNKDPNLLFEYLFQSNKIFQSEHDFLKNKVPFSNFDSTLEQATIDSKISLVLETYFWLDHAVGLSEKTFRTLLLPRPFILFNSPGSIQHLRRCGFDVFDDIVDHSYDDIFESVPRQEQILDEICMFETIDYNAKMVARLEEGCNHNRNRLKQLSEQWPQKLQSVINKLESNAKY